MNETILFAYLLIIVCILVWATLLIGHRTVSPSFMNGITIFGGAFLLGSCFINLVPHIFLVSDGSAFVVGSIHFKITAAVLVGFLIQMLLESLTNGVEHGQSHEAEEVSTVGLMLGLSLHSFLEGMPLVDIDGEVHRGLLYGIVLHNIPISVILIGLFVSNGYSAVKSILLLSLFAVMTPIGSLCNLYLLPPDSTLQRLLMGVVVGILLHVSVSILFDHHEKKMSLSTVILVVLAFVASYFTPGCPEIYPL